ncbi:alpha-2-macroglobulin [Candidatus Magnetomoraceae bacterium gMMP-1]
MTKKIICYIFLFLSVVFQSYGSDNLTDSAKKFRVLDISERTYENGPAITVLLSEALDSKVRHDQYLRISDSKTLLKSAWVLSEDHRVLYFPNIEPETGYSITVLEGLTAVNGQKLEIRKSKTLTTRKITPVVSFASNGLILPAKMTDGLPIVTVNTDEVEVEFFRLNDKAFIKFINWQKTTKRQPYYNLEDIRKKYGEFVFSGRFDLDIVKNKRIIRHIPIENIDALQKPGVYLAVMRQPGEYAYKYQSTYFFVTDIALHARIYKNDAVIIASSLKTGMAVSDVKLSFYNYKGVVIHNGLTDNNGIYHYPDRLLKKVRVIKADYNEFISVLPLNIPALDLSEFELHKRSYRPFEIFVYSPRDLYRPGEKLIISALLRDYDGKSVQNIPLKTEVYRPDGRKIKTFTMLHKNSAGPGYYQLEFSLPKDAQTGKWRVEIKDNPSSRSPAKVFKFNVEEFLPERMKLELSSDQKILKSKSSFNINVTGAYLYGAPASENRLSASVRIRAKRDLFDKFKDFEFGDIRDKEYRDYWELPEKNLDKQGFTNLKIENKWRGIKSPLSVRGLISLYESGGRPVVRAIERIVWPAHALVGIRPLFNEKSVDEGSVSFEIIRVKPDESFTSAKNLLITVTKEDRDYFWEYSESKGWQHRYTEKIYEFLTDTIIFDAKKPAEYSIDLKYGRYVLSIKDPETNLITSFRFRVGYWWHDDDQGTQARPDRVQLHLDKPSYLPGDVINLSVKPPHKGDAVIMVEGSKLLWFKRIQVPSNGTTVKIPVAANWDKHNIYVSALVFRPASAKEKITPNRAVGLVHLPLNRSRRKLELKIECPEKLVPNTQMTVNLKLSEPVNDAFVSLAAVDTGILNITDYKLPDAFKYFFEPRRYDITGYDIYNKVIENLDGKPAKMRYGGDADLLAGGKRPETKVKLLSLFQSPVKFDENGEAEINFNLPDFNGQIRLMALAFSKDCFGSAEHKITVSSPIVTQLSTPRFLSPGDETEFALDLHNLSGEAQQLTVNLSAADPVMIDNELRLIKIADDKKVTLRFPVKTKHGRDKSIINLQVKSKNISLSRDWQLGIRPAYPAICRKLRKVLTKGQTFKIESSILKDLIPETIEASLKISPVIPLNIRNAMQGLITYPYGCLEQTTSSAYPLLYADSEKTIKYNLLPIEHEDKINRLNTAISRLSTMQLSSGGFGLWSKNSPEEAWLSVYVTDFLLIARNMGLNIPTDMLDKALKRIETYLLRGAPLFDYGTHQKHINLAVQSYAGYVLAGIGRAPLGSLRILYDNNKINAKSSLPLIHLGLALKFMGDTKRSKEALNLAVKKRCPENGYWGDYSSPVRDLALTIALLVENKIEIDGLDKLMLDLEDELNQRQWLSTQEKYAIFKTGLVLESLADTEWKGSFDLADKKSLLFNRGTFFLTPEFEDIKTGISFTSDSKLLYASVMISGHTKEAPPKDDSQISIERKYYDLKGISLKKLKFKVGELLLTRLIINSTKNIPDAIVVDLLPAGFELENPNLKHSIKLDDIKIDGKAVWRFKKELIIFHEEFRDDRYVAAIKLNSNNKINLFYTVRVVSPGNFAVPPAYAESMYRPEIRGIGESIQPVKVISQLPVNTSADQLAIDGNPISPVD